MSTSGTVTRVYDGDTVEVETALEMIDVRLVGINAPEVGECFGDVATAHLTRTLEGRFVELEVVGTDQFGRALATVWHAGRNINIEMAELGLAIATTSARSGFVAAERRAVAAGLGLWSPDSCSSGPIPALVIVRNDSVVDPRGPDDENLGEEWITIRNEGDSEIDIGGWGLRDESSRHRYTFGESTRIGAGEALRIASADRNWDPGGSPVWNNEGDIVIILDGHGRVVDHWRYDG